MASEIRRGWQAAVTMAILMSAPPGGRAAPPIAVPSRGAPDQKRSETEERGDAKSRAPGEDDTLYRCAKAKEEVLVSFRPGVQLSDLATWAMGFTCKNFVYSGALASRQLAVTVMAPRPMRPSEAWRLFLVALQSMNLTVVEKGALIEIVEAPTAKRQPLPIFGDGARSPGSEELMRVIFRPRQVTSANLAQALTPLLSGSGEIAELAWAGVVLVTDHGSHVARMREMMEEIDRPGTEQGLYFLPLRNAAAGELVETLRALLAPDPEAPAAPAAPRPKAARGSPSSAPEAAAAAAPARILADERTNSLVLLASRAAYERTRALVERLDVDVEGAGGGRVHVHFLEHTSAEKIAETLGGLLGQRGAPPAGRGQSGRAPQPTAPDQSVALQGEVRVTADVLSNAILVLSSDRDYVALQKIVRELDAPRRQVHIEALIIEVGSGWSRAIGAAWHGGGLTRKGMWVGALGHPQLSSFANLGAAAEAAGEGGPSLSGFLGGIIGLPIPGADKLLGTSIPSFSVLFQALATRNQVEIVSAPHVTTTDHVPALLTSGQTVPFVSGVTGLPGTAGGSVPVVAREPVGLTLKVTPHIGSTGQVRLDIDLVIEELLPGASDLGPSTSKRQIVNSVVVGDQHSAVLGGLVTHKVQRLETKIPLLGDLPVLGIFFRRTERKQEKSNLIVLITPYVLVDTVDGVRQVERVFERRAEFLGALERLDRMGYRVRRDGRRMRGLVAEMVRRLDQVEEERAVLRRLERPGVGPAGPIEPAPSSPSQP
ncbi:MAG TPA: type II secretion system secretin GspD [Kofleriaceae bacterium]|nr:type II secretion system secretin GspD [Kofleriaceae bacterium]